MTCPNQPDLNRTGHDYYYEPAPSTFGVCKQCGAVDISQKPRELWSNFNPGTRLQDGEDIAQEIRL